MERESNFKYDSEVIGKVGEKDFIKNVGHIMKQCFKKSTLDIGWRYVDVSDDEIFQLRDIDFVLLSRNFDANVKTVNTKTKCKMIRGGFGKEIVRVEVKTDTKTYKTRNFVYELISHYDGGCWATTKADMIYYVCVDEENPSKIMQRYVIYPKILRDFLMRNHQFMSHNTADITNPDVPIVMNVVNDKYNERGELDDPILNILFNIDFLAKYEKIVKEIIIPNETIYTGGGL